MGIKSTMKTDPLLMFLCDPSKRGEVSAFIGALPDEAGRIILRLRYCEGLQWIDGKYGRPSVWMLWPRKAYTTPHARCTVCTAGL